ncbi:deoxyribonuclease IV [Candidatus Collierbacteria bacterium]|nr:deoxyribonuclease IV [Candidatus Collierbacteria bacterium]
MKRVGGHVSTAGGIANALKNTTLIDGNCLQIFAGSPRSWARKLYADEEVSAYLKEATKLDYTPTFIHALYLVNLATDNPDLLQKSIDSLIIDLTNGRSISSAGVIVHLGSHQGRGFSAVVDQTADVIKQIINSTEKTPFVIENSSGQKGKIGSIVEIGELFAKVKHPRLKLCLDSAHLFEAGYDLRNPSVIDTLVNELTGKKLLDHLVCLHLNDSKTDFDSRNDQHANLGDGQIGLAGLSNFVNHPSFAHLPLILETPGDLGFPDAKQIALAKSL